MRRVKSQAAKPTIGGASILPLKQRCAGPVGGGSPRRSAPAAAASTGRRRRLAARLALVVGAEGALQRLLADAQRAGLGIGAGPDAIPDARRAASCRRRCGPSPLSSAMPSGVSTSAKPAPVAAIAARDHGLRPVLGQGRPDQRLDLKRGRQLRVLRAPRPAHRSRARRAGRARRSGRRTVRTWSSSLGGGPPGLGSPRTMRTSMAW